MSSSTDLSTSPAIVATDVRKAFDRGVVTALDGITLEVDPCEYVAITGPSGGGKSTFLHLLAALDRADSGTLQVAGEDLSRLDHPNRYRRERVGLVFQMHNLLPHLDALGNIGVAMLGTGLGRREARDRAREVLGLVGLERFGHRRPPQLSGGERQRLALARALANRPSVLLADEPTGSLDTKSVDHVLALIAKLRAEEQVTVVLVTHDTTVAASADRIIHLRDGRVVDD